MTVSRAALLVTLAGCSAEVRIEVSKRSAAPPPMVYVEVDPFDAACCVPTSEPDGDGWGWVRCELPQAETLPGGSNFHSVDFRMRTVEDGGGEDGWRLLFVLGEEEP